MDSISKPVQFDCEITETKQKLDKKYFASAPALHLRANNQEYVYAILQLGKRDHHIYIYIKVLDKNVCIKRDQTLEIQYKNGETSSYANDFHVNCDGIFVKQLEAKKIKRLNGKEMNIIKIYTYWKNYEFLISSAQNYEINNQIQCLSAYEIKRK